MTEDDKAIYLESLKAVQEAAKQLVAVTPILQGIYFAAVSMSDLKKVISGSAGLAFLFVSPVIFWLICLAFALQVFMPPLVREEDLGPEIYKQAAQKAYRYLQLARCLLVAGLLCMAANVVVYFAFVPLPSSSSPAPTK